MIYDAVWGIPPTHGITPAIWPAELGSESGSGKNKKIKTMMKKLLTLAILATSLVSSFAVPITGNILFTGNVLLDSPSAGTATKVTAWPLATVSGRDGSFVGFVSAGNAVAIAAPWSFNSGAIANFWTVGGFTFDLTSSAITSQDGSSVHVNGIGLLSGNGYTSTVGSWSFTTQDPSLGTGEFSFSASGASVPDGGSTLALMGGAVLALGAFRRKLAALVS
jgi:hypothetical protein